MKRRFENWHKFALVVLPLGVAVASATAMLIEWRQPASQKAVRMVRESKSRKENFTVQQYLYATVYYRKDRGEPITIDGWRVDADSRNFLVSFTYTDASGQHTATWEANLEEQKVAPHNQEAKDLSWQ
jgi:hypothetical protein